MERGFNMTKERAKALTNLVIAVVLLLNAILTAMGKNPLPFDETETTEMIAYFLSALATLHAWWKNNNMTIEAETAQRIKDQLVADRDKIGAEGDPLADPEREED